MKSSLKKIYISMLVLILCLFTFSATTMAWIGIFSYSSTNDFNINLKVNELDQNYYLTISSSGNKDTFSDMVNLQDIQKQILKNRFVTNNYIDYDKASADEINAFFNTKSFIAPTTTLVTNNEIDTFYELDYYKGSIVWLESKNYYKFDLYLSVDSKEGIQSTTQINSNVFLTNLEEMIIGSNFTGELINGNPYIDAPSNPIYDILRDLPEKFTVNSANAARIAFSIYNPIDINSNYSESDKPTKTIIYQGGTQLPTFNNGIFNLGGNLPEDYNTAMIEMNQIRPGYNMTTPIEILNRGDLEINYDNNKIFESPNIIQNTNYLGVQNSIQTKIKITIHFWFEGYDADCLRLIDKLPIWINLTFTADVDE